MGFLQDLFSGGASNLVSVVGNVLDKVTTSKEEKMQLDLEMKKADMQYQIDLKKLSSEEQKMMYGEMDSARRREVDVSSSQYSTKLAKNVGSFLALGTTALSFLLFAGIIFNRIDQESKEVIFYMLGVLSAIITQIFSYYFGSSQGSAHKSQSIENMFNKGIENKTNPTQ
jgi:hypothetical protein